MNKKHNYLKNCQCARVWTKGMLLAGAGALLMTACAVDGYDDDERFVSDVTGATLASPSAETITVTPSADGKTQTISWPVVKGAGGYLVNFIDEGNPAEPIVKDSLVDGCSVTVKREEDMNYLLTIKTMGRKDANNQDRKSTTLMATSDELQTGDAIEIDGQTRYLGGNIMVNGSFDMGFYGWLDGKGNTLSAPYFQVIPEGGNDDGAYLQAYGNGNLTSEMALHTVFTILPNTNYYFSVASCNMPSGYDCKLGLSEEGMAAPAASPLFINNTTDKWLTQFASFNSKSNTQARVRLFNLASKAQVDQMMLCQLFSTRDSAIADGIAKVRITAEAFKDYNTKYNYLNEDLTRISTGVTTTDAEALQTLAKAMEDALQAYRYLNDGTLVAYAEKLVALKLHGYKSLELILNAAKKANLSRW